MGEPPLKHFSLGTLFIAATLAPPGIALLALFWRHGVPFPTIVVIGVVMFWSVFLVVATARVPTK